MQRFAPSPFLIALLIWVQYYNILFKRQKEKNMELFRILPLSGPNLIFCRQIWKKKNWRNLILKIWDVFCSCTRLFTHLPLVLLTHTAHCIHSGTVFSRFWFHMWVSAGTTYCTFSLAQANTWKKKKISTYWDIITLFLGLQHRITPGLHPARRHRGTATASFRGPC